MNSAEIHNRIKVRGRQSVKIVMYTRGESMRKRWKVIDACNNILSRHFTEGAAIIRAKEMKEIYGDEYKVKKIKSKAARA